MVGGGEQVEIVHAPAVAALQNAILARPHYLADQPFAIAPHVWHEAQAQLREALERRGWPLLADGACKRVNFLLCGVPVVMSGD